MGIREQITQAIREAEDCEYCPNQGWFEGGSPEEPEQIQCQFCYENPKSRFNLPSAIIEIIRKGLPKITPEQLHTWYLEAIGSLDGKDFNHMADRPYEMLTDGQKSIDTYIANKISTAITKLCEEEKCTH